MTNTFANICKGDISSKNIHDPWNILISTFLEKKVFDKNLMLDLLSKARFDKFLNLFEYLAFLKKTLTFAIFTKNEDCLIKKQLLDYFEKTTYNILFEKYHLVKILRKLIYLILKDENLKKFKIKDEKLLSSLAIDNLSKSFNLQLLSDLSSALLLLGILTKNKKYLNKSYSLTTFISNFLDHKNRFFEIIGQSEKFYKITSLYSSLYQNFYFNGTIFQNPNFLEIAQNCLKKIDLSKVSFFYIAINDFLANNIVKNRPLEITENYKSYFIDKETETFIFRKKSFSSIASFKTFNSSLGSFHFNNILIPAIGPQTDNLFDCSNFGVFSSNPKSIFKINIYIWKIIIKSFLNFISFFNINFWTN